MLRHFIANQASSLISHTFNASLWYIGNLSKDRIWAQTRPIQRGRGVRFNWVNHYIQTNTNINMAWDVVMSCRYNPLSTANQRIFSTFRNEDPSVWGFLFAPSDSFWGHRIFFGMYSASMTNDQNLIYTDIVPYAPMHISLHKITMNRNNRRVYINWVIIGTTNLGNIDIAVWNVSWYPLRVWAQTFLANLEFYLNADLRDMRIYSGQKTQAQVLNIMRGWSDNVNCLLQLKWDEWSWSVAFNSLWWSNATYMNGVTHITRTDWFGADFQNQVGYTNNAGVLIPRNELNITQDVQGNSLQFSWRVKYDARLSGRFLSFDWVDDHYIAPVNILWFSAFTIHVEGRWFNNASENPAFLMQRPSFIAVATWITVGIWSKNIVIYTHIDWTLRVYHTNISGVDWVRRKWTVTYDWSEVRYYANWLLLASEPATWLVTSWGMFYVWSDFNIWWRFALCDISDVRIYNRAITQTEINNISSWFLWDITWLIYKNNCDEWSWTLVYNAMWWGSATLFNWVSRGTWPQWSIARQTRGYSIISWVTIPRNEIIPAQDVLWNPLQFPWDWQSLLPWGIVDLNYWLAPELIRKNVPTNYTYWSAIPSTMRKVITTNQEKDFIVLT